MDKEKKYDSGSCAFAAVSHRELKKMTLQKHIGMQRKLKQFPVDDVETIV